VKTLVIVVGVTSSGKTSYCARLKKPCIHFDDVFDYEKNVLDFNTIKKMVQENENSDSFFIDGFVYYADKGFKNIKSILDGLIDRYELRVVYMKPEELHKSQMDQCLRRPNYRKGKRDDEALNREFNLINLNSTILGALNLKNNNSIDAVSFFKRTNNDYIKAKDQSEAIGFIKDEILWFVDSVSGDPQYQTIEWRRNRIRDGYSLSWRSWGNINKTGINFKEKSVCDIGSFSGYFSIKAAEAGAKEVIGYDKNQAAIRVSKLLARLNSHFNCTFESRALGSPDFFNRTFDVIFVLNMIHHIEKRLGKDVYINCLNQIFEHGREIIFEVNQNQIDDISKVAKTHGFKRVSKINTHRKSKFGVRFDLYFSK